VAFGGDSKKEEGDRVSIGVQGKSSIRKMEEKFKTRLVSKGYSQRKMVDYE
jgi:hypothetical protein